MSTFNLGKKGRRTFKALAQEAMVLSEYDHKRLHICTDDDAEEANVGQFSFWDNQDYAGASVMVEVRIKGGEVTAEVSTKAEMTLSEETEAFIEGDSWADSLVY